MDIAQVLTGGGSAGLVIAIAYALKLLLDWLKEDRAGRHTESMTTVTNAQTANAVILKSLEAMERENARMRSRVVSLETELADSDAKMDTLRARLIDAQIKISNISRELDEMKLYGNKK